MESVSGISVRVIVTSLLRHLVVFMVAQCMFDLAISYHASNAPRALVASYSASILPSPLPTVLDTINIRSNLPFTVNPHS